jgi:hypothetical protein
MRKSLLTAMGIMALALAGPSAALAHHGRGHHRHHHHEARAHHAKFRIVHIGAGASWAAPPSTTPPAPENAATVASYTGGVLTLTLKDGSTVSGKVTENTRIRCIKATPPPPPAGTTPDDRGPGDDWGPGDDQDRGEMSEGQHGWGGWHHGDHGDDDDQEAPGPPCDSSALVAGAIVRAAELRISSSGAEFEKILLVR